MFPVHFPKQHRPYLGIQIQKEELKEEVRNYPLTGKVVQVEFCYTHIAQNDEEAGRPRNPFHFSCGGGANRKAYDPVFPETEGDRTINPFQLFPEPFAAARTDAENRFREPMDHQGAGGNV